MRVMTLGKNRKLEIPSVRTISKTIFCFLVGRASVLGVFPFGLPFWAVISEGKSKYIGLLGILLGVVSGGGDFLKYTFAAGLYLIYISLKRSDELNSIFCGMFLFISGVVSILFGGQSIIYIAVSAIEGVIAALTYFVSSGSKSFYNAYKGSKKASQDEIISTVLLSGVVLVGFSGIYITQSLRLSVILGLYIILCLSRCVGLAAVGSVGVVLGFISGIDTNSAITMMGVCGLIALSAGILKEFGKIGAIVGFVAAGAMSIICTSNYSNPIISIYEMIATVILFTATPKALFMRLEGIISKAIKSSDGGKEVKVKEYLSGELKKLSRSFTDLADSFLTLSNHNEVVVEASDMFDRVADRVCSACPEWGRCWIDSFSDMYKYMYDILKVIETKGYCDIGNMPIVFKEKCINPEAFIVEFNHHYEMYKQSAIWHGEVNLGQDMVARQYHEISKLIEGISEELESGFSFIESAELKLDAALEKAGFYAKEINVIENTRHEPEVYIKAGDVAEEELLEQIVSDTIGMPMRMEKDATGIKFVVHNKFYIEYAVCQHSGDEEELCGDTIMQFTTDDSKFCVLLCDGMGLGDDANEESRLAANLFQDFIKAGFIKDTAVRMINSTLVMKAGKECFSTIDMAELDLRTGEAEFLKVGAAESFLRQGDRVEMISAKALPVGILEEVQAPTVSKRLSEGDVIVMVSDGISDTGYGAIKGGWLKEIIKGHDGDMQALADNIIKEAREKSYPKACDDMTVAAMKIKKII